MADYEAGRELDALIAEKVMGWRWLAGQHYDVTTVKNPVWLLPPDMNIDDVKPGEWDVVSENDKSRLTICAMPHYSTEIAAAWEVVEKLVGEGHVFIVKGDGLRDGTYNPRWAVLCGNLPRTDAHTAPLAICRAALKVMEARK